MNLTQFGTRFSQKALMIVEIRGKKFNQLYLYLLVRRLGRHGTRVIRSKISRCQSSRNKLTKRLIIVQIARMFPLRLVRTVRLVLTGRYLSTKDSLIDLTADKEGIATLTMQRLPVNSINLEFLQEFNQALDEVGKDKAKGLIITSASGFVFSAGLDITEIYNPNTERLTALWTNAQRFWMKLFGAPYPTAAAINGHAPAGGCMIALCCEYRTMVGEKFTIGLNESAVGTVAPQWLVDTMCHVIPKRKAELALTTGRMFSTDEALKIGLIDEKASDKADAYEKSKNFIRKFDEIPLHVHRLTKLRIRANPLEAFLKNREADLNYFKQFCLQPKVQKSVGMYLEKLKHKSATH